MLNLSNLHQKSKKSRISIFEVNDAWSHELKDFVFLILLIKRAKYIQLYELYELEHCIKNNVIFDQFEFLDPSSFSKLGIGQ